MALDRLEIKLWDVATGGERASTEVHGRLVSTLAFSPDGRTIAWADDALRLWDVTTGRQRVLRPGKEWVTGATFSPRGTLLAAAAWDTRSKKSEVQVWEVASGKELVGLGGSPGHVSAVSFSPDGRLLATAGEGAIVRLWDLPRGQERARLRGHTAWILTASFSPDGRTLATGSQDSTVKLWQLSDQ